MHSLVLIRHAIAEDRAEWSGADDAQRPLTVAGRAQARRIAKSVMDLLAEPEHGRPPVTIATLRSSPALRCVQTVEPLAKRAGIPIDSDDQLMEGCEIKPPSPRAEGAHVICAHGDNIPWLLDAMQIDWDGRCKKGSIWLIQRDARGGVVASNYHTIKKD